MAQRRITSDEIKVLRIGDALSAFKKRNRKASGAAMLLTLLFVLFTWSCTKTVNVPDTQYDEIDSTESKYWRVTTVDGKKYTVSDLTVDENSLIILSVNESSDRRDNSGEFENVDSSELPLTLKFADVALVERVEIDEVKTGLVVVTLAVVATAFAFLVASYSVFGKLN